MAGVLDKTNKFLEEWFLRKRNLLRSGLSGVHGGCSRNAKITLICR